MSNSNNNEQAESTATEVSSIKDSNLFSSSSSSRSGTNEKDEKSITEQQQQQQHVVVSATEKIQKTEAQMNAIEEEVRREQPLTSERLPISALVEQYSGGGGGDGEGEDDADRYFRRGARCLSHGYAHMRRVRGDGSCYYRALLYAVCEDLTRRARSSSPAAAAAAEAERQRLHRSIETSLDERVCGPRGGGHDRFALESFHEELVDLLASLRRSDDGTTTTTSTSAKDAAAALHRTLTEENSASDYCTFYLRVLTACHLRSDPDRFGHFLDDPYVGDVDTFCRKEVEPMGKECGPVQVIALAEALAVNVRIEYLDGRPFVDKLARHEFGPAADQAGTSVTLLYRPGHYDILYRHDDDDDDA